MNKNRKAKNDGLCKFYLQSNAKNSYSAKENVKSESDLQFVKSKFYSIQNARQEDVAFAEAYSLTLNLKIKVHFDTQITTKLKAVIKDTLYDIAYVDHDYTNRETYIYLTEVRRLEK